MEADGHVVRHADLSDRRAKVWSLTSAGGLDWIDVDAGVSRTIYGGHLQTGRGRGRPWTSAQRSRAASSERHGWPVHFVIILLLCERFPPQIFFSSWENRRVKRSRHKTALEADNIARRLGKKLVTVLNR